MSLFAHRMRLQLRERLLQVVPSSIPKGAASLRSLVRALAASPLRDIQTRFHGQGKRPAQAHAAAAAAIEADAPRGLPADLDYHPRLSWAQEAQCFLLTSVFGCIIYLLTRPRAFSPLYVAAMAALLAGVLLVARLLLLEDKYVARQKEGPDLGDPESIFLQVDGIQVHAKVKRPRLEHADGLPPPAADAGATPAEASREAGSSSGGSGSVLLGVHCYHGFGANVYTWQQVQQALADGLQAVVSAHDMPGFGLTERPESADSYGLAFNGRLGGRVLDQALASRQAQQQQRDDAPAAAATTKRVLVGHSLGGICTALETLARPQDVAALVLVAPAIIVSAPPAGGIQLQEVPSGWAAGSWGMDGAVAGGNRGSSSSSSGGPDDGPGEGGAAQEAGTCPMPKPQQPSVRYYRAGQRLAAQVLPTGLVAGASVAAGVQHALLRLSTALLRLAAVAAAALLVRLAAPALALLLRTLVRNKAFWINGLQQAYHSKGLVTAAMVDGYRGAQLVRGFDRGLVLFLLARFSVAGALKGVQAALGSRQPFDAGSGGSGGGSAEPGAEASAAGQTTTTSSTSGASSASSIESTLKSRAALDDGNVVEQLAAAVVQHRLPVLIVHGSSDKLVPASNSLRLARMLPGSELLLYDACGHMPHEELPRQFVLHVSGFLRRSGVTPAEQQ